MRVLLLTANPHTIELITNQDTDAAITTKGQYYPPGKIAPPGERKLYLLIEAPTERGVKEAKSKIKEIIETAIAKESLPGGFQAKYKV